MIQALRRKISPKEKSENTSTETENEKARAGIVQLKPLQKSLEALSLARTRTE